MKKIFFLLMAVFSLISSVSAIDIEIEGIDIVDSGIDKQNTQQQAVVDKNREREVRKFHQAVKEDSALSYQMFLFDFPQSRFKQETEDRLKSLTFYKKALSENTIEAFRKYLSILPEGYHTDKVLERISALDFRFYSKVNTLWGYEYFLKKYPASQFSKEAADRIEDLRYNHAKFKDEISSYERFLLDFPSSKYILKTKQRLVALKNDKSLFDDVVRKNSVKAYGKFLKHHPSSPFATSAEENLAKLRIRKIFSHRYKPLIEPFPLQDGHPAVSVLIFKNPLDRPVTFIVSGKEGFAVTFGPGEGGRIEFFPYIYEIAIMVDSYPKTVWAGKHKYFGEYLVHMDPLLNDLRIIEITPSFRRYSRTIFPYTKKATGGYNKYMAWLKDEREKLLLSDYPLKRHIPFRKLLSLSVSNNERDRQLAQLGFMLLLTKMPDVETSIIPDEQTKLLEFEILNNLGLKGFRGYTLENIEVLGHKAVWPLIALIKQTAESLHGLKSIDSSYSGLQSIQNQAIEILVRILKSADDIVEAFKYADGSTRLQLLKALAKLSGPEHEDIFLEALEEQEYAFKNAAVIGLMNIASAKSLGPLINVLYEVDSRIAREFALMALKNISYEGRYAYKLTKEDFLKVLKAYDEWLNRYYRTNWEQRQRFFISNMPRDRIEDDVFNMILTDNGIARRLLCEALSTSPLRKDLKLLEQCAKDPDKASRKAGVKGIGKLNNDRGLELIHEIIKTDSDNQLRELAVKSLADNGSEKAIELLQELFKGRKERIIINALAETGSPAAAQLLINGLFKNRNTDYHIRTALQRMGKIAIPALQKALSNIDENNRLLIIAILSDIKDEEALNPLYYALNDINLLIRKRAAEAIYRHETVYMKKNIADILISALRNDTIPTDEIINLLMQKKITEAADAIEYAFLRDIEKGKVNYRAISALSTFNKREHLGKAVRLLLEMINNKKIRRNYSSYHALGQTGDKRAVEYLIKLIEEGELVDTAVYSLGHSGNRKASEYLIKLLEKILRDPAGYFSKIRYSYPQVRLIRAIIISLGKIKDPAAIPVLEKTIREIAQIPRRNNLHAEVILAIDNIGGPDAELELLRELKRIRKNSGDALSTLSFKLRDIKYVSKDVINLLMSVVEDGSPRAMKEAIYILGSIQTPDAANIIADQFGKTKELDSVVIGELRKFGEVGIDHLFNIFNKQPEDKKINFIHILGYIGSHRAIIHILKLYEERSERIMSGTKNGIKQSLEKILEASFPGLYIPEMSPSDVQRILRRSGAKEGGR